MTTTPAAAVEYSSLVKGGDRPVDRDPFSELRHELENRSAMMQGEIDELRKILSRSFTDYERRRRIAGRDD